MGVNIRIYTIYGFRLDKYVDRDAAKEKYKVFYDKKMHGNREIIYGLGEEIYAGVVYFKSQDFRWMDDDGDTEAFIPTRRHMLEEARIDFIYDWNITYPEFRIFDHNFIQFEMITFVNYA